MLKKYDEQYFEQLELVANDRLEPANISVFFWSSFIVSAIVVLSALGLNDKVFIRYEILPILVEGAMVLLALHLLTAILFTFEKIAYRFQRLQMILVTVVAFLLSISFYLFFFVLYNYSFFAPSYVLTGAIALFLGGIVFLGWSTLRAINRVKQGHFKDDGDGMFDLKKSKIYIGTPIIFTFIVLGGVAAKSLADIFFDGEMYGILFFAVLIQHTIAIALPEFFLVTYCKFRFKSFIVR